MDDISPCPSSDVGPSTSSAAIPSTSSAAIPSTSSAAIPSTSTAAIPSTSSAPTASTSLAANPGTSDLLQRILREKTKRNWRKWIWDEERKAFCGRTALSWAQIVTFYICFYSFLAAFFSGLMLILVSRMSDQVPTYILEESVLKAPGLAMYPIGTVVGAWQLEHRIQYSHTKITNSSDLLQPVHSLVRRYQNLNLEQSYVSCEDNQRPGPGELCGFNLSSLGPSCSEENIFGYNTLSPCFLLKLNRVYGWIPEVFERNESDILPEHLEIIAEEMEEQIGSFPRMIWVSCFTSDPNISVTYSPYPGFPAGFYPFTNQPGYLSPLVAVQLGNVTESELITVKCKVYVKNIQDDYKATKGAIKFTLEAD